jgi:hypothetical protein
MKTFSSLLLACALATITSAQTPPTKAAPPTSMTPVAPTIPASAAVVTAPLVLKDGAISQLQQTELAEGGKAIFTFSVPAAGDYVIHAVVNGSAEDANSFFLNIDAQPEDPLMIWDIDVTSGFEERIVSWRGNGDASADEFAPKIFKLTAGEHKLIIVGREPAQLKSVSIRPAATPGKVAATAPTASSAATMVPVTIPVSAAVVSAPLVLKNGAVSQPQQTLVEEGGKAIFTFTVPKDGDYVIHTVVNAPSEDANSFFLNVDAPPEDPQMIWDIHLTGGFAERVVSWRGNGDDSTNEISPKVFKLTAGEHKLIIVGREPAELKSVSIRPAAN